jgi:phenylacetate-CoA ligase
MRLAGTAVFLRRLAGQRRFPFRPWEEIRRAQEERLARAVRFACERVPRYRALKDRLGKRPEDVRSVEDLAVWPILESPDVDRSGPELVPGGTPREEWIVLRSGGTTGSPKRVYFDARSFLAELAYRERARFIVAGLVGRRTGYREAVFFPPDGVVAQVEKRVHKLVWAPRRMRVERRFFTLYQDPEEAIAGLRDFRAQTFHGFGSYLARLFQLLLDGRASFPLPRAITYTSDEMPPSVRRVIEHDLRIPVFSLYGAIEGFNIGFECGEGEGLHMNVDLYPFRIVGPDGRTVPPGESGSIVMSNVVNRGTVLLNYRIGDRGRLLEGPCPCGRGLPRLAGFDGRDDEWALLPGGRRIHSQELRLILIEDDHVWQMAVFQDAVDRFRVFLVANDGTDREALVDRMRGRARDRLGPGVAVEVTFVDEIPRTAGGKLRPFESLLPPER